jgi:leucyl aminopeptidase
MDSDCRCIGVFEDQYPLDEAKAKLWNAANFSGKLGETLLLEGAAAPVLLTGLGTRTDATAITVRLAGAAAGRRLRHLDAADCELGEVAIPSLSSETIRQAAAEGVYLGSYAYLKLKSNPRATTHWKPTKTSDGWELGDDVAHAVMTARDLVNDPANVLTPSGFAERCNALASMSDLAITVLEEKELQDGGFGGILAVGKGSVERPLLIQLDTKPEGKIELYLVGKGVTFDSGGLSLKGPDAMIGMKHDMSGAAAVAAAMSLLSRVAPNLRVTALLPMVENMPGPYSTRPGDVVTMRSGKTVEILNTDFEGRLILGDALAFASEASPAAIIDLASLTYAAIHALGERTAALFGNDADLLSLLNEAASTAGENVWQMPLPGYLHSQIESTIADIKNFPGATTARSSTAALFLQEFVPNGQPWAHLDIAGPAWAEKDYELTTAGGTGFGVRMLVEVFASLSKIGDGTFLQA